MNRVDLPSGERLERAIMNVAAPGDWVRAVGTLSHVALRPSATESPRGLEGTWTLVSLDAVVFANECTMHGVLSRQGAWGPELCAGELVTAEIVRVTCAVFSGEGETAPLAAGSSSSASDADAGWAAAISASHDEPARPQRRGQPEERKAVIPDRIPKRAAEEQEFPEARDRVDHFHFGLAEVLKSDGDRLHVKVDRDGRIKEIALQMLKVTRLEDTNGVRFFRLDRKF